MEAFIKPFKELEEYKSIVKEIESDTFPIYISGCIDSQKSHLLYGLGHRKKYNIIITYNELKAKEIYEDMRFFKDNVYLYPAKDVVFYSADIHSNYIVSKRLEIIRKIIEDEEAVIIMTIDSAIDHLPPLEITKAQKKHLKVGDILDLNSLKEELVQMGYEPVELVEGEGQFSIRGGIIDIYEVTEDSAYRLELWDDEIDTIRTMDVNSQRSIDKIEGICIYPASEMVVTKEQANKAIKKIEKEKNELIRKFERNDNKESLSQLMTIINELKERIIEFKNFNGIESYVHFFYDYTVSIFDYFDEENSIFFLDEPVRLAEKCELTIKEFQDGMLNRLEKGYLLPSQLEVVYNYQELITRLHKKKFILISTLTQNIKEIKTKSQFNITTKSIKPYNSSFEMLIKDLKYWQDKKYKTLLLAGSRTRAERLAKDLFERDLNAYYSVDFSKEVKEGEIVVGYGNLHKGFEYPLIQYAVISESDVFGKNKKKKKKKKQYEGKKIQSFTDLKVGDYVVHENYGLGIFKGIEKVEVESISKDYIKISYRDGGNLYIATNQLDLIQKYIGADGRKPKLNKLGSSEWKKTKTKVKKAVNDLARELVKLYAVRQEKKGFVYSKDTVWQKEFEEMFPFEETEDQLNAIEEIKEDMESGKIMDRLLCGDVGYGKTEVAIRAAFKAIQDGKQVAYLVPTTILAQQHYNNFVQRMKDFPVKVEMLSRFRSSKEQKRTIDDLRKGFVDIVIGTHRILSKDLKFNNLGLLIVDEEQRFGVSHKERIKHLKENIDVLTLTATPIPRTLHMSLIGIRDMSVLEEPPEERLPIQTYVLEYNEEMIREAIRRELGRDGQVYYVYNRVRNIEEITSKIKKLVPDANIV
ncbi:MAG: transcription-repair coupling factor, partial [Eubacteriales bacterium]